MEDTHMSTPPIASTSMLNPFLALGQTTAPSATTEHAIKEEGDDAIRSRLGTDINILSKKMIFALHRADPREFLPQFSAASEALGEFKDKHATVLKLFHRAAIDLQGSNYYKYQRSFLGAMQEYIEAMTLEYYLVQGKLMPKCALEADLNFMTTSEQFANPDLIIDIGQTQFGGGGNSSGSGGPRGRSNRDHRKTPYNKDRSDSSRKSGNIALTGPVPVNTTAVIATSNTSDAQAAPMVAEMETGTPFTKSIQQTRLTMEVTDEDYLLGIADLTGELMRLAINTLGQSLIAPVQDSNTMGGIPLPSPEERVQHILSFLRNIKSGFDGLVLTRASPLFKKMSAFKQSLNKIEMACYNVKVRGAEYPPEILRQMLINAQDNGGGNNGAAGGAETGNDEED
ncbi:hypothetical protein BGZ54_009081 [Gamsiella multidivaricata]|nr:hypothetical protein BGZ54_009081 [Gamsiella multidivaricata]